ncbi:MAG: NAD(P)/FAD-dependent oxidoreductase [Planctomycetota bacterium]|jgi:NAD(P)H-nitrite reductase large subunit
MSDSAKYVIVGNSTAAVAAAEAIRERDPQGRLVMVSREERHTYSRPLITYLLGGKIDEPRMDYRARDFYEKLGIELRLGTEVEGLDAERRLVTFKGGGELGFERLLLASGGAPIVPKMEGADLRGVFTMTGWDDVDAVRAFLAGGEVERAVVIGAGMIGVKAVEALRGLGLEVTAVELAERPLAAALDATAGGMAVAELERNGVDLRCGTSVERILATDGRVGGALLADGATVICQMVVVAVGVRPDVKIAAGAVEVDRGVVVNEDMETSVPGIYAAGDVAQAREILSGESMPIPVLPGAFRGGRVAGANMAGGAEKYSGGLVMNAISVFDLPTISVGLTSAPDESCEELSWKRDDPPAYRKAVLRGNRLVGAVLVGDVDRAGIFTGLIRGKVDVSGVREMILSDEFGVLSLPAEYRKHVVSGQGIEV